MRKSSFVLGLILCLRVADCHDCTNPNLPKELGLYVIENKQPTERNVDYALWTTPPGFSVRQSTLHNAGLGVFADTTIPKDTRLGPYDGVLIKQLDSESDWHYLWTVSLTETDFREKHYIDALPTTHSSWLRYVNCANTIEQENLYVYQYNFQVYYVTYECIKPGTELLVWYGDSYAQTLGIRRKPGDYQRRFNESEVRYIFKNTVQLAPTVPYRSSCYKFTLQCPFKTPAGENGKFVRMCLPGKTFDVCKYKPCKTNPCTGKQDCKPCKGYCFDMGRYLPPSTDYIKDDNVNTCECNDESVRVCTRLIRTIKDMCVY